MRWCADMGAARDTSQVLAAPTTRPVWDVLPFLPRLHAGAPSPWKPSDESWTHQFCPEVGGGLETTRDKTLTHNVESRSLLVLTWSKKSYRSHLVQQEELQTNPHWVSLLPQLSKKHWWGKSRAKQQERQQLPMASCFLKKDNAEEPLGLNWWGQGQSMMKPNRPCCIFCLFKFGL